MVGKFVSGKVSEVRSVRIMRSGMVVIEYNSKCQRGVNIMLHTYKEVKNRGVISGAPVNRG